MKSIFFITRIILFILFLFATSIVYACEPCPETLNFDETVEKSDLIIIGQRTDFSPSEIEPDSINVKIIEVLKGDINQNQISINSWDGMCEYGIVVDDKKYVMLLQKRESQYDAVDFGCSVKTFPVVNDLVDFNEDSITIDEFTDKLDSQASRKIIDNESQKQFSVFYYIIPAIVILIVLFFIILKMREKRINGGQK